jgi:phosphoglycerate dehydrogenase-like enzyme
MSNIPRIIILDDYQQVALNFADWSMLRDKAEITVSHDHLSAETALIQLLQPFQVVCVMRERSPLTRNILSQLPNLKLIVSTGQRNASIDMKAAEELGIQVAPTGYHSSGAPELTWALILAVARHIPKENASLRSGGWQQSIGTDLSGKTIGIVGLGNIGNKIARYALAFDMKILAWSENLSAEKAENAGALLVDKETLFRHSDFVTIHLVLSSRSRGIISAEDLNLMKPSAFLINTSRGPLIDEQALIQTLQEKKIAGAAIDVFDQEPLPSDHPFRQMNNVLCTPHIGYVTAETYKVFYQDTVKAILEWIQSGAEKPKHRQP